MKWADLADGVWTIATAEREKGNAGSLALPAQALAIIAVQPKLVENPYVFAGRGQGCADISQSKGPFDAKLPKMERWTLHDLRRTARSLLARVGVRPFWVTPSAASKAFMIGIGTMWKRPMRWPGWRR
jgi:hypothetical protein